MSEKYNKLFTPMTLKSGVTLDSRFVLAPMVANASTKEGFVTSEDLAFMARRNQSASLLITGSANVFPQGNAFGFGLGNEDERYLPGLKSLAQTMKAHGGTAILQLFHPGRGASYSYEENGLAYAPSSKAFEFLTYPVTELTTTQIENLIAAFSQAALRAYQAGFDGVEIHGANHFLLQQFFSKFSNERNDQWGGDFERRCQLTLDVLRAVQAVIAKEATRPFLIGYRLSPEEIHGENIGYLLEDSLLLLEKVLALDVDYVSISLFGPNGYRKKAEQGKYKGQIINQVIREKVAGRVPLIVAGDITSPEKALDALNYGDLVALASLAIVEPDFKTKLAENRLADISLDVTNRVEDLALAPAFKTKTSILLRNGTITEATVAALNERLAEKE